MPSADPSPRFTYASLAAAAFIIYSSLYPFSFHGGSIVEAVSTLSRSHNMREQPWSGLIANIVFYIPLGLFCAAAQNKARPAWRRVLWTTLIGALLCLCMETLQYFDDGRVATLTDVYPNVAGALLGALLALPLTHWLSHRRMHMNSNARQTAALLLLLFLAYRLFPYVPTLDLHGYWRALKPVLRHPGVSGFDVGSYAIIWTVIGALLADLAGRMRSRWLIVVAILGVLCCKIIIIHNHLTASELVALPISASAWLLLSALPRGGAASILAVLLALVVFGDRLLPFDWQSIGHGYGWVPFASILHGSMAVNTQALLDKLFLYAGLIWLLTAAGLRHLVAGTLVAAGLFTASLLETHLPGRSAEITDTVIAVAAAVVLAWLSGPLAANYGDTRGRTTRSSNRRG